MPLHWQSEYTRLGPGDDLAGKVVDRWDPNLLAIVFADKTYLCVEAVGDDDRAFLSLEEDVHASTAFALGLIDAVECSRAYHADAAAYTAKLEQDQRAEYERLKAKFEKGA